MGEQVLDNQLSNYVEVSIDESKANPVRIAARAAVDGHEFGEAGEVHLSDSEARSLRSFLNEHYG